MTYSEIYYLFLKQNPHLRVADYRPCSEMYGVPDMANAIVVWLEDGNKVIYQVQYILKEEGELL